MLDGRIAALRAAVDVAPADRALRSMLATTLETAERWPEAIEEWKSLTTLEPGDTDAKVALARAYVRAGRRGPAEIILEELERAGRMSTDAWRVRGALLGLPEVSLEEPDVPAASSSGAPGKVPTFEPTDRGPAAFDTVERPRITFADVGGMEPLKEAIRLKIIHPAHHPEIYAAYGQRAGGGLLLYGPPGCGKTHLARATAGELGASFLAVGIADVLSKWIGGSEQNLRDVFATARQHAPAVLFFDEIDALAANRTDFQNASGRHVINQFLAELDGVGAGNEGVLVLGATNAPWHMDPAFRRPGRFDEVLFVPPPDSDARAEILRILLRDRPVARIDVNRIVGATDGFSGADLRGLVERAIQGKLRASLLDGTIRPIETDDLRAVAKDIVPTTREWFASVRNYVLYANQSGLYDGVRPYLK